MKDGYIGFLKFDGSKKSAKAICKVVNKYADPEDDPEASFLSINDETVFDLLIWDCKVESFNGVKIGDTVYQTKDNKFYVDKEVAE